VRSESHTAIGVAALRAVHQIRDGEPKILDDTVIVRLLGQDTVDTLIRTSPRFDAPEARALRSHVVLRSRYTEDRLAAAAARGIRQFLVLGAGLDTFAYRQPAWARDLRILEVDQPASQQAKRQRLAAAGIAVPANVAFVEADFEHRSLHDILAGSGHFAIDEPSFISWLGVTVYLTEPAIDAVFQFVASLPASSELVFTFYSKGAFDDGQSRLAKRVAELGEPLRTWFDPEALEAKLRAFGFSDVSFLMPEDAAARYFPAPRPDHLPPPRRVNTASAIV
jgi:methyltransferase (TIGR00027 family)